MKKLLLISIILLLVMVFALPACSSSQETAVAPVATAIPGPTQEMTMTPVPTATLEPAPQTVAQIKIKSGTAEYRSGNLSDFIPATDNIEVTVDSWVRSGPDAQVALEFLDGSSLVLLPNTEIEIQNYTVTYQNNDIATRIARVAVISGDISGDVRQDLIYPPSIFEIVSAGEIYTIKGTVSG